MKRITISTGVHSLKKARELQKMLEAALADYRTYTAVYWEERYGRAFAVGVTVPDHYETELAGRDVAGWLLEHQYRAQ